VRIACVVGHYPSASETFISREIEGLGRLGVKIDGFAVWRGTREAEELARCKAQKDLNQSLIVPELGVPILVSPRNKIVLLRYGLPVVLRVAKEPKACLRWGCRLAAGVWREGWGAIQAIRYLPAAIDLIRRLRELPMDRVHAHFGSVPSTVGWVAATEARLPFSFAVHARDVFVEPQFLARKARAADHIIACNSAAAAQVARLVDPADRAKIELIPHGLPLRHYLFRREPAGGEPLILGVGRFVEKKGFPFLLRAVARLREEGRRVACWLIGDGPQRKYLASGIEKLRLGDAVTLKNWLPQDELISAYERATMLVAPSMVAQDGDRDGLPNVVVEAAAKGLPIVATDVGGIRDLVRDGETGLVARPRDAEDLAEKITAVLEDPEGALARARRAREQVEARFDQADCIGRLMAIFARSG